MQTYSTYLTQYLKNTTLAIEEDSLNLTLDSHGKADSRSQSILIIQSTIASVGIVANLTVIVVFLNHKKLRRKIPNIFIINQVRRKH